MSPNIRRHSHEFEPKYTPRRRRSVSSKVRSLFLRWGLPVIAGTTLIATADVPGRVARALQDRPEFLRETIRSYSDNNRFLEYQTRNHAYYISKGIVDADDNQKLTDSLTRLDILVQAFQEGTLTENDFLQHIFGTHERIVSEPGTYMDITVHNEDKTRRVQYSGLEDMLTQFVTDVTSDSNNPKKKTVNLKIVPREQGGGYIFSFHFDNQDIEVHVGFRLSK